MTIWQALLDGLLILRENWTVVFAAVVALCLGCSLNLFLSRNSIEEKSIPWRSLLLPGSFFGLSLVLRLAFVTEALVPPYFDSVEHYGISEQLVSAWQASRLLETLSALTTNYYHLGFHFLASLLALSLRANPIDVILVLGQVLLAAVPVPIFFLVRYETRSGPAAFFGMLLAGFGWYMPGFAVNWGKYPALAGLLAVEIVLTTVYFVLPKKPGRNQLFCVSLLLLGMIVTTLFHTRALVVIVLSFASWLAADRIRTVTNLPSEKYALGGEDGTRSNFRMRAKNLQYFFAGLMLAGILVLGKQIRGEPVLELALDPYLGDGFWITLTIVAMSPFALLKFPRGFYFSLLFILGTFAALFIPIGIRSPGLENQTIFDRPFVEMLLYLPLSILAGLGLAGFLQALRSANVFSKKARLYATVFLATLMAGFTGWIQISHYNFYPADCCNFVKYDDTVAMDWIDQNLSADARILVAAAQLNVLRAAPSEDLVGTDAGIWIPALTGRTISLAPFDTDFASASMLEELCQRQIDYIYVGSTAQTFNRAQFAERAEWYDRILFLPSVQLYQVTGCP